MYPEDSSQWRMPGYCKAYSSPAVYMMQDTAAVLEELTCPQFEYGNTDSDSEREDVLEGDGDPSVEMTGLMAGLIFPRELSTTLSDRWRNGSLSPVSREEKNNRERVQIMFFPPPLPPFSPFPPPTLRSSSICSSIASVNKEIMIEMRVPGYKYGKFLGKRKFASMKLSISLLL